MKLDAMTYCTRLTAGRTAADLEDEHLHKQIQDISVVARTLIGEDTDLSSRSPVCRMWAGYEHALCIFGMLHCMEFGQIRGYADEEFWKFRYVLEEVGGSYVAPPWIKDKDVLRSHRSNLARMYPDDYGDVWTGVTKRWPYVWPFVDDEGGYDLYVSKSEQALMDEGKRKLPPEVLNRVANLS